MEIATLTFHDKKQSFVVQSNAAEAKWLMDILDKISIVHSKVTTFQEIKNDFENKGLEDFELFWYSKSIKRLRESGLLVL